MMKNVPKRATAVIAALAAVALLPLSAQAVERVGPVNPANGFPLWFQDSTGITLDLCVPTTAAEVPWCNMVFDAGVTVPETFPENWSVEHFYWMGEAELVNGTGGSTVDAGLIMGLESTFSTDAADPGAQITFARIRWDIQDLPAGTYRVYTPYIVKTFVHTEDGERYRYVEDLGANCAVGSFDCTVTDGNIDLFLLPSASGQPGGAERPWDETFLGPTGRRYIANPAAPPVAVTGSKLAPFTDVEGNPHDPNTFLIERLSGTPAVLGFTTAFTIMGRLFEGTIVADAKVVRASYASDGAGNQVDVYASGFPARPARDPGDPIVTNPTFPTIGFYSAPCEGQAPAFIAPAGLNAVPLARNGSVYWALEQPTTVPAGICVEKSLTGNVADATYESVDPLGDQVFVTRAQYTPSTDTLVVEASSSDPALADLTLAHIGDGEPTPFVNGVATVTGLVAPPSVVSVLSNQHGVGTLEVTTGTASTVVPATGVTLIASPTSPQPAGTPITFEAQGEGADPFPYQYKFWLNDGTGWRVVQDWGTDATWELPSSSSAGTYYVTVYVRTGASETPDAETGTAFVLQQVTQPASGVTLLASATNVTAGTGVTFTAAGQGGSGTYQYKFYVNSGYGWMVAQDYSPTATWTLPSDAPAGTYYVTVYVRTGTNVAPDAEAGVGPVVVQAAAPTVERATGVTVTSSHDNPVADGSAVTFTAAGVGGTGTYQYKFFFFNGTSWQMVQDYSPTPTWTTEALGPGDYYVTAYVRTSSNFNLDAEGGFGPVTVTAPAP